MGIHEFLIFLCCFERYNLFVSKHRNASLNSCQRTLGRIRCPMTSHIFTFTDCPFFVSLQNAAAPSPLGQMNPQDGMPGGPMPPGFFPVST